MERQRASAQALQLGDEARRLEAQCLGLQRELAEAGKEVARLKVWGRGVGSGMDEEKGGWPLGSGRVACCPLAMGGVGTDHAALGVLPGASSSSSHRGRRLSRTHAAPTPTWTMGR